MEVSSFGSFTVLCRVAQSLRKHPLRETRASTFASFLNRCSPAADDVAVILQLLLCAVKGEKPSEDAAGTVLTAMKRHVPSNIADETFGFPTGAAAVKALQESLVFASHGSLSLEEVMDFVSAVVGGGASLSAADVVRVAASCTELEFLTILSIASGDTTAVVGPRVTPLELLEPLGALAVSAFEEHGNVADAVRSAIATSPRLVAESSFKNAAGEDAVDAGYESPEERPLPGAVTPHAPPAPARDPTLARIPSVTFMGAATGSNSSSVVSIPAPSPGVTVFRRPSSARVDSEARPGVSLMSLLDSSPAAEPLRGVDDDGESRDQKRTRRELPPCPYGAKCRRKNPEHFKEYSHPSNKAADASLTVPPAPVAATPVRAKTEEAPVAKKGPPPCRYGASCIRKNPLHFVEYSHPPGVGLTTGGAPPAAAASPAPAISPVAAASPTPTAIPPPLVVAAPSPVHAAPAAPLPDPSSMAINGVAPLKAMAEHVFVYVEGAGAEQHKMKNCGDGAFTCSCPVWRFQNRAANARTCKHLRQYLGDDYERERCGADVVPGGAGTTMAVLKGGGAKAPISVTTGGKAKKYSIEGGGVLLAQEANRKLDYTNWWLSEKLDGVRAYWNGSVMMSRNGNAFNPPDWFVAGLPKDQSLDGELFGGRGKFQTTVGIAKSSAAHAGWKTLTYEVFDIPSLGTQPFETRQAKMEAMFPKAGPRPNAEHVHVVEQRKCAGQADLEAALKAVEAVNGEGLMLRQPGSQYAHKRSSTLLKVKNFIDVDAIIRGYDRGKGRNEGRIGALCVELANGKQFNVGTGLSDAQRNKPPAVGTVVIVKCQGLTDGGIPRFPAFQGCRFDITWPPPSS